MKIMNDSFREFLNKRGIQQETIQLLEDEKIDAKVILVLESEDLVQYFPKHGDRIAVLEFCRNSQGSTKTKRGLLERLRQKMNKKKREPNGDESTSSSSEEQGNEYKNKRKKGSRKVELGWIHNGRQVRTKFGGGSRKVDISKAAKKKEILEYATSLFFPNGCSSKGDLIHMDVDLKDFKNNEVDETCTVEDFFKLTKLSHLRFYLSTVIVGNPELTVAEPLTKPETSVPKTSLSSEPSVLEPCSEQEPLIEPVPETSSTEPCSEREPSIPEREIVENDIEVIVLTGEDDDQYNSLMTELYRVGSEEFPVPETSFSEAVCSSIGNTVEPLADPKIVNITLHRGHVLMELIDKFRTIDYMNIILNVEMCLPNGSKEAGLDIGGVFRDTLSEFWSDFYDRCTVGTTYKVPVISEDFNAEMWKCIAKIIYVGWKQVRYFPIKIAPVFMEYCLQGKVKSDINQTFMNYLSSSESDVLRSALTSWNNVDADTLIEILDGLECKRMPNQHNIGTIIFDIAHKELIQKPKFIIDCWQHIIHGLMTNEGLRDVYKSADATSINILKILQFEEHLTPEQSNIMYFLKRFIRESDSKELSYFLRFCTGADIVTDNLIKINFSSLRGVGRRPVAHTCSCILELPVAYMNYPDFRSEMKSIISANVWIMDII